MAKILHSTQPITVTVPDGDSLTISSLKGSYSAVIVAGFYKDTVIATDSSGGGTFGPYLNGGAVVEIKAGLDAEILFDLASSATPLPKVEAVYSFDAAGNVNGFIAPDGSIYGVGAGGGVTDHGALTGLADDDHTQYLTAARGDVRYPAIAHTHTNVLAASGAAITSTVAGVASTITPAAGTIQDALGFDATGALVKGSTAPATTTNTLVAASSAITSTVNGVAATVTPAAGTVQDALGFNAAGALVKTAVVADTNTLVAASNAITSTVNGVVATVTPAAGTIQDTLGFNAAGDLVKAVAAGSSILQADGTQTANRTHDFANFDQTWNDVANFTKNIVDGSEITNLSYTVSTETSQVNFSPDVHNLVVNDGAGSSSALTITPALSKLEVNGGGLNKASYGIEDGTVGAAIGDPQLFLKTNAVSNGTAVAGQVLTLNATTGESEFATVPSGVDTIQTAASTGTTAITAWGSVVLIPTLAANITLTYPTPVGNIGKTIKIVRTGTPNAFTITHTPAVGTITLISAGAELNTAAGAFAVEAIDATNVRQVSNVVSAASITDLTFGRVKATATLASTSFSITAPGTKVPFDTAFYFSGTTVGIDTITVSQTGRYRCSWFMHCGSGEFNGDGTFHVVSGGVSLGSVFVDMMQAAGVNQIANFIDVNLDAGADVALHYQPVVADAVPWGAGSYFQVDQMPTAVAPVVNTVAEYGSSILAATNVDVNVSVGNWVTMAGLSATLPSAGTYRVFWKATGEMADAGTTEVVVSGRLRNNTAGVDYTDSRAVIVGKDSPTAGVFTSIATGTGEAIVTVTGTSEIVFQTRMSALATVSTVVLGDGNLRSAAYISYEKIAGQLPSTGATVDYLSAGLTSDQVTGANGVTVVLNSGVNGNIPLNTSTGFITLSAGKTYEITASVAVQSNSANTQQSFLVADSAGTTALVAGASFGILTGAANVPYSGGSTFIYTPTVNQDIRLYFVGGGGTVTFKANGTGGGTSGGTLLTVRQIGSTNTIGGNTNVNDQSSSGYFDIGNMRQQWGTFTQGSGSTAITFPAAFANAAYVITGNDQTSISNTTVRGTSFSTKTTTGCNSITNSTDGITVNAAAGNTIAYIAIGQKP